MRNRYTKYLMVTVLLAIVLTVVFDLAIVSNPHFNINDLAMNLLSEFAGMIFTVAIFNEFLNQKDKIKLASRSRLLYQELEQWLANLTFTFSAPARQCMTDFDETQLWKKQTFDRICHNLKLDELTQEVHPQISWYLFFYLQGVDLENDCKSLLERFQNLQDQKVTDILNHFLYKSDMLRKLPDVKIILESDVIMGHDRPKQLINYYNPPSEEDIARVKELIDWLSECKKMEQITVARNKKLSKVIFVLFLVVFPGLGIKYLLGGSYLLFGIYLGAALLYLVEYAYYFYKKKRST